MGLIAHKRRAYAEALESLKRALLLAQPASDPGTLGDVLLSASAVLCAQGSWANAEQTVQHCLVAYRDARRPQQAEQHFQQALALAQRAAVTPLQIKAALGLLHSRYRRFPSASVSDQEIVWLLLHHPACAAETRLIQALVLADRQVAPLPTTDSDRHWTLEQICDTLLNIPADNSDRLFTQTLG